MHLSVVPNPIPIEWYLLTLIASFHSPREPNFDLKGLEPGVGYNIFLSAKNAKGASEQTYLQAYTLKNPEKQTGKYNYG